MAVLLAILFAATALRFYQLDHKSLWGDEIAQVRRSSIELLRILDEYRAPPRFFLPFVLEHFARRIGTDEFWLRLPSTLASVLAVAVMFCAARRLIGRAGAVAAALLIAVAPYQIWYAQEARMYAAHTLYTLLSLYYFLALVRSPNPVNAFGLFLANTLAVYNHLFGVMPILSESVIALGLGAQWFLRRGSHVENRAPEAKLPSWIFPMGASFLATALVAIPLVPGTLPVLLRSGERPPDLEFPFAEPFQFTPTFAVELLRSYGLDAGTDWRLGVSVLLCLIGIVSLLLSKRQAAWVTLAWIGVPLALLSLSHPRHEVSPRYLIFLQPVYLIWIAQGALTIGQAVERWARARCVTLTRSAQNAFRVSAIAIGIFALGVIVAPPLTALYARAKINDWRALSRYLNTHAEPGDLIIGETGTWATGALDYYLENNMAYSTPRGDLEDLQDAVQQKKRLWYVSLGGIFDKEIERWARANLTPIADTEWERPELVYRATDGFIFPQSESYAHIYVFNQPLASQIVYFDRGAARQGKTHIAVNPNQILQAKLQLPAFPANTARTLEIQFKSEVTVRMDILAGDELIERFEDSKKNDAWQTHTVAVPPNVPQILLVKIKNLSGGPLLIHSLKLF